MSNPTGPQDPNQFNPQQPFPQQQPQVVYIEKKKKHPVRNVLIGLGVIVAIIIAISIGSSSGNGPDVVAGAGNVDFTPSPSETSGTTPADGQAGQERQKEANKPKVPEEPYTLKVTGCERSENDFLSQVDIELRITNHTDAKATYFFDISVEDKDGNVVGSGFGSLDNVRPGKSGKASSYASLTDEDYKGKITCLVEVTDF